MFKKSLDQMKRSFIAITPLQEHPEFAAVVSSWIYFEWSLPIHRSWSLTLQRFDPEGEQDILPMTFVATVEGAPAAVASLRVTDSYDFLPGATPWICNVYVHEGARGLGLATRLCQHIAWRAAELGFAEVFLATSLERNSLYHRLGFAEVSRLDYFGSKYVLRLDLARNAGEASGESRG